MKIASRVGGSVRGAVLANCSPTSLRSVHAARRHLARPAGAAPQPRPRRNAACPRSSLWLLSTFTPDDGPPQSMALPPRCHGCSYSTATDAVSTAASPAPQPQPQPPTAPDKRHLLSLVSGGDQESAEEHFDYHRDPYRRGYAFADGPRVTVSERRPDVEYPSQDETLRASDDTQELLWRLYAAIAQSLRRPTRVPLEPIYLLYRQLPEPRMLHLTGQWRNRLLRAMGCPGKRDTDSMLRYFALVADVKNVGLTLRRSQWNAALVFAAKYTARVTVQEMESTLRLWREMEREAKISGNEVTFNILFDVAAKAGNFALADMIYKEMESRGIEFNRYHHVSLMHYFGLKFDSAGIRAAYRELVEAGEMVDTVVLNCVIAGLLRCGEEAAAEETYQRMRDGYSLVPEPPPRDYMMNKVITKVLMIFSRVGKKHPQLRKTLQATVHILPDLHTYKMLVQHFAIRMGSLNKVAQFLDEMKHLDIPVHPTIFLALFKGFYVHGGFPGSDWSEQRLDGVLSALYQARDIQAKEFRIDGWLVIWALRAVRKCSSSEAVMRAFDALVQRWDVQKDRQPFMHAIYANILQGRDMKSPWGNWDREMHRRRKKDGSWL